MHYLVLVRCVIVFVVLIELYEVLKKKKKKNTIPVGFHLFSPPFHY